MQDSLFFSGTYNDFVFAIIFGHCKKIENVDMEWHLWESRKEVLLWHNFLVKKWFSRE